MLTGRVYDAHDDGTTRVLVDRLWPRGVRRDDPRVGVWLPAVAPSTELRHWYGHDPAKHDEFVHRYEAELATEEGRAALDELARLARDQPVTLVTATKDVALSHLPVVAREVDRLLR
ncbi:MAG TPA: DUF488 family protein [Cellulomonas sp.]|nr:DUF488 family protein [Cellulomonas sp.]